MKPTMSLAAAALILLAVPAAERRAEAQGRHPAYLHALSDLRRARGYLNRLTPSEHIDELQLHAVHELESAIGDIKAAAIDDGKDLNDHPPIDAHIQPRDRFAKAHEALDAAFRDAHQEEDDAQTRGLQRKIVDHVSRAISDLRDIEKRLP